MAHRDESDLTYALTYRDVVEILRLVNESSNCESLDLELGDLKLSATRRPAGPEGATVVLAPVVQEAGLLAPAAEAPTGDGLVTVRAPMLGTFYRAPAPGERPYVEPGDIVGEDDTIGLIDVMKLFTQIPAGTAGRVVEIVAQDGALVEHGQPLLLVEPSGASGNEQT